MHVGRGQQHRLHRRNQRVVINDNSSRRRRELHGAAFRRVINDVANEVDGTAECRLHTQCAVTMVETSIPEYTDVVRAAVGFDAVVFHVRDVVAVEINRDRHAITDRIGRSVRVAVRGNIHSVVNG